MIIIIGAGISGLVLAHQLYKNNKDFLLLEKSLSNGGYLKSIKKGDYLLELGPNSLLADANVLGYLHSINATNNIIYSNEVSKERFIYKGGKYRPLPSGPMSLIFSGFFGMRTKVNVLSEFWKKPQNIDSESVYSFFERRFGKEICDYALDPFVSGIYAGDPHKLSIKATFPNIAMYENTHGSVLKGFIKNKQNTSRKKSISFKGGMQYLADCIASNIPKDKILYATTVVNVEKNQNRWVIQAKRNEENIKIEAEAVVVCTPAFAACDFLRLPILKEVAYAPMAVVHTVYKRKNVSHPLNGFGGLNPSIENRFSLGSIWTSSVYQGRCPNDEVLFTTFIGGDKQKYKLVENEAWQIKLKVHEELSQAFGINAEQPEMQHFFTWEKALPQYYPSIFSVWEKLNLLEKDKLYVCANWKDGVSLSDCIEKAEKLAKSL